MITPFHSIVLHGRCGLFVTGASLPNVTKWLMVFMMLVCVLLVMSDEPSRRSVNKPMTRSEMEHQLLKHLQQECNASRQPMSSRDRVYSESSEIMTNQPLGTFATYMHMSTVDIFWM